MRGSGSPQVDPSDATNSPVARDADASRSTPTFTWPPSAPQWLAFAALAGTLVGQLPAPPLALWTLAALSFALAIAFVIMLTRPRAGPRLTNPVHPIARPITRPIVAACACALLVLSLIAGIAAWTSLRLHHAPLTHVSAMLREEPVLVRVAGRVSGPVRIVSRQQGALGQFSPHQPGTRLGLHLTAIERDGQWISAHGKLYGRIDEADPRLAPGMRIEADGWLAAFGEPGNPGPVDFRPIMHRQGFAGTLTLKTPDNWRPRRGDTAPPLEHAVDATPTTTPAPTPTPTTAPMTTPMAASTTTATSVANAAYRSLHLGMNNDVGRAGPAVDLLDALLLGRRSADMRELTETFRRVGLAHVLSISGAHLAILMGLCWAVVRLFVPRPPRTAMIVLTVLALYLLAVPPRVPIVRAGIMAGAYCMAFALGRQWRPLDPLAIALAIVLFWRPQDIVDGGFQLSFGIVAGLIVLAPRLREQCLRSYPYIVATDPTRRFLIYAVGGYALINLVAFSLAVPLVAYHFQMICPLTMLLGLLALPAMTALLGLGYLKIVVGLLSPTLGGLLAGPLVWLSDTIAGLVTQAAAWPGAMIDLPQPVSAIWTLAALAVVIATLAGPLLRRPGWLGTLLLACTLWLAVSQRSPATVVLPSADSDPPLRMHMLDVGDGACFLLRIGGDGASPARHVMFDAGSQTIPDPAHAVIIPVLRRLGVPSLDAVIVSHANLDHFNAILDIADTLGIHEVWLTPQFLEAAHEAPVGSAPRTVGLRVDLDRAVMPVNAATVLGDGLRQRDIPVVAIHRGFTRSLGQARLTCLWPPRDWPAQPRNDTSVVVRLTLHLPAGPRRVMLSGDIEADAITQLLAREPDLRADVADLPHHGSFTAAAPRWFQAVQPTVLLQSTARSRLRRDRWPTLIAAAHPPTSNNQTPQRWITATDGLAEIVIDNEGRIDTGAYRAAGDARRFTPTDGIQ